MQFSISTGGTTTLGIINPEQHPKQNPVRSITQVFKDKPIEVIGDLIMVLVGFLLTVAPPVAKWQVPVGALLTTFGGVLLSRVSGTVRSAEHAKEVLRPELELIHRHLVAASSQIKQAIQEVYTAGHDPASAIPLVAQATGTLYNIVGEIGLLTGSKINIEDMREVSNTLSEVQKILSTSPGQEVLKKEVLQVQKNIENLEAAIAPPPILPVRKKSLQRVPCPVCNEVCVCTIADGIGESSASKCPTCNTTFHVNRASNGEILTKPYGATLELRRAQGDLTCPNCAALIRMKPESEIRTRYCLRCYTKLVIDWSGRISSSESFTPVPAFREGPHVMYPKLVCPRCSTARRAFIRIDGKAYAACKTCEVVLTEQLAELLIETPEAPLAPPP